MKRFGCARFRECGDSSHEQATLACCLCVCKAKIVLALVVVSRCFGAPSHVLFLFRSNAGVRFLLHDEGNQGKLLEIPHGEHESFVEESFENTASKSISKDINLSYSDRQPE